MALYCFEGIIDYELNKVYDKKNTVKEIEDPQKHEFLTPKFIEKINEDFKKSLEAHYDEDITKIRKELSSANDTLKKYTNDAKEFKKFLDNLDDLKDDKAWDKAKEFRKNLYMKLGNNSQAKRLLSEGEIHALLRNKQKLKKLRELSDVMLNQAEKMYNKVDKATKILEAGDFFIQATKLTKYKGNDNVEYFINVKKLFNSGGDLLEGAFGDVVGIGDFIKIYNKAFQTMDVAVKIVADYTRKIEKATEEAGGLIEVMGSTDPTSLKHPRRNSADEKMYNKLTPNEYLDFKGM
ncbi:hypothetical protein AAEX28_01945 [Lentisphaerota bacterium WC36G]|nr:hypothetical protein LJT99_04830 [Lentisphaerae bacterium WC36]